MKTTVERIDDTTVKLSVTVDAPRVKQAIDSAARELASSVRVPGFRPGRVPRRVLESRLGKGAVVQEAVRDSLPAFYADAVEEAGLEVLSAPEFDVDTFEDGKDAQFSATVEVRPEIELPDYTQLQVPHPDWEVTEEELSAQLDQLRERFAELESVERPVREGDFATITVTGSQHGQTVEEASGEDILHEVDSSPQSDSELDRQLIGKRAGEIVKFNDTLGPDYDEPLAGQELSFTVMLKEVKEKNLPELDDDFAITASEFDTIDELREDLQQQLARSKRSHARSALRGRVVEELASQVEVALPESLVNQELQLRLNRLAQQAEAYGLSPEQFYEMVGGTPEEAMERFGDDARGTVKAQLIVDAVGRAEDVQVTQEDLSNEIMQQAARLGRPPEEIAQYFMTPERVGALFSDAFRRRAIDLLVERVDVLSPPPDNDEDLGPAAADPSEEQAAMDTPAVESDPAVTDAGEPGVALPDEPPSDATTS